MAFELADGDHPSGKTENELRIEAMDHVADTFIKLIDKPETSEVQKGRLFAQVMAWQNLRLKLLPPEGGGGKLKEMSRALNAKGGRGNGSSGSAKRARDGRAITSIIRNLPSYGGAAGGNQKDPERKNGSAPGNGGLVSPDGNGHDSGLDDELGDRSVL